jgi:hypothetical protein
MDMTGVQEPLAVTGAVMLGYGPRVQSAREPFVIQTTDLEAVKRMVGIEDRVARNRAGRMTIPDRIELGIRPGAGAIGAITEAPKRQPFVAAPGRMADAEPGGRDLDPQTLSQLNSDDVENIRRAAYSFVRGNSELVSGYRPLIEAALGTITIPVFALLNVTVEAGSVLEFGPGVHALVAHQITIEFGGMIRTRRHLTINCTKMSRPSRPFLHATLATGVTVGSLARSFRPIFSE